MIPKFRAFVKSGTKQMYGGVYEKDAMVPVGILDITGDEVTVWGCGRENCGMCDDYFRMKDIILMQTTGLEDKNGVEIYEGDIVKIDDDSNSGMKAKVVFETGAFGLVGIDKKVSDIVNSNWNDDFLSMAYFSWEYEHLEDYLCNVVIIGNIYENPELLEVAE